LPPDHPASREEEEAAAGSTNAKVLDAFRTHLFRSGLSPKVVERDVAHLAALAEYLAQRPEPHSLREADLPEIEDYLSALQDRRSHTETQRRQLLTGLNRFVRFLLDTECLDYDAAQYILEGLKGQG
jgi:site-specific recombinase XerD